MQNLAIFTATAICVAKMVLPHFGAPDSKYAPGLIKSSMIYCFSLKPVLSISTNFFHPFVQKWNIFLLIS